MSDIRIPESLNHLAESAQASAHDAAHLLNRAADHAGEIAQRSLDAVRGGSRQLREHARHAGNETRTWVRDEPVKSLLIAAATGAVLTLLIGLLGRSRRGD